jgi:hypothetical protein
MWMHFSGAAGRGGRSDSKLSLPRRRGEAAEQGDEADEAWSTSEFRSLSPVLGRLGMFPDTGGYSRANLYRIDAQRMRLRDADSSYTIDVATGTLSKDEKRCAVGTFLGSFDFDGARTWRFILLTNDLNCQPNSRAVRNEQPNSRCSRRAARAGLADSNGGTVARG